MKADIEIVGHDVGVMTSVDGQTVAIRAEVIEADQSGKAVRSGKYIHLQMKASQALQLLGLLEGVGQRLGWPKPDTGQTTEVPPAGKRQ